MRKKTALGGKDISELYNIDFESMQNTNIHTNARAHAQTRGETRSSAEVNV